MQSSGKVFERRFKQSGEAQGILTERIPDSMGRFRGVKNVSDFFVYRFPLLFYFELKSYASDRIPFKAVSDFQREGLLKRAQVLGVVCGVLLNYRSGDSDFTFFVEIGAYDRLSKSSASITRSQAAEHGVRLNRIRGRAIRYDLDGLLTEIARRYYYAESGEVADDQV